MMFKYYDSLRLDYIFIKFRNFSFPRIERVRIESSLGSKSK